MAGPFKLRSQGSSFKMMGSSPAKHPLERTHTHPKEEKVESTEEKDVVVKGPGDSDVMNIIKKRKQSGPKESEESKQEEITELVEERDPNKIKTEKTKTKTKKKGKVSKETGLETFTGGTKEKTGDQADNDGLVKKTQSKTTLDIVKDKGIEILKKHPLIRTYKRFFD